jgi:positive regulator of sigma E activity
VVFWGVELTFHYIFGTHLMTVVGGATGLTVGYILKYNLDKHFTFRTAKQP